MTPRTGAFRFLGHDVWFEANGAGGPPCVVVHGGPGAGHDYLDAFRTLAADWQLVFYDQLGCGRSPFAGDIDWEMDHFVDELEALRIRLDAAQLILVGHSWGGMVALEYALRWRDRVQALVLASTAAAMADVRASLSCALEALRRSHPRADDAGIEALFWRTHVCRLKDWPPALARSARHQRGNLVYETLYGPNEFEVTGTLKDWSVRERLGEIACPTLITAGAHDELAAACWMPMLTGVPGARAALFGGSAHLPHIEEPEAYFRCIGSFLREVR